MISPPQYLLTCTCGPYTVGFDLRIVQEVLTEQVITSVPRAPAAICGLLNLRGNVVTAMSLHRAMGLTKITETEETHRHLILSLSDSTVSIIVNDVGEVIEIDPLLYFSDVAGLPQPIRDLTRGIYTAQPGGILHLEHELCCKGINEARP